MRSSSATLILCLTIVSAAIGCNAPTTPTGNQGSSGSQAQAGSTAASGTGASGYGGSTSTSHAGTTGSAATSGTTGTAGSQGQAGTAAAKVDAGPPVSAACDGYDAASTLVGCAASDCLVSINKNTDVANCVTTCFNKAAAPSTCSTCAGGAAATTRAVNCMSLCDNGAIAGCSSCMTGPDFTSNLPRCGDTSTAPKYTQKNGPCGSPDDQEKSAKLPSTNYNCITQTCSSDFYTPGMVPTTCMSKCYKTSFLFGDACSTCLGSKTAPARDTCANTCITNQAGCLPCIYGELDKTQPACVGN